MNKKMKKIINGVLVGTMVFSMASAAFANDQQDAVKTDNVKSISIEQRLEKFKSIIEEKIANGEITQEQVDKLLERMENKEKSPMLFKGIKPRLTVEEMKARLEEQVANGKITQEEADEILERIENNKGKLVFFKERGPRLTIEEMKTKLEERVTDGEITQEQADKIIERMESRKIN